MKSMILENIRWIFSGIGVVIIVSLWTYFKRRRRRQQESTLVGSQAEPIHRPLGAGTSLPPHAQIIDTFEAVRIIKAAPILQQDAIAKHYEGTRVDCTGTLDYMAKWVDNNLRLDIEMWSKDPPLTRASIVFYVGPTEYTGLGLLKKGDPVRVSGIIDHASSVGFTLKDAKLISYGSGQK